MNAKTTEFDFMTPKTFVPPSLDEVLLQASKIGLSATEAQKFWLFYDSKDWYVGKNKMKRWHSAIALWKLNSNNYAPSRITPVQHIDRSVGTTNEGRAALYKGLGKVVGG